MNGDRFKTNTNYFESTMLENETPFRLQYIQSEVEKTYQPNDSEEPNNYTGNQGIISSPFKEDLFTESEINLESEIPNEELLETAGDFEYFSNEIHDLEFSDTLGQIASEAEDKFQNFVSYNITNQELEDSLADPNFESTFNQFFESSYGPLVAGVEKEIDRLSEHLDQNLHPGMSYEDAHSAIESFQIEPDQLFGGIGKFLNKVKRGVTTVLKKGVDIAGTVLAGPLRALLSKIKPLIKPMLQKLVKKGLGLVPEKYRAMAQKALDSLGLGSEGQEVSEDGLQSEIITNNISSLSEGLYEDLQSEAIENQLYGVDEIERELDREIYLLSQREDNEAFQETNSYGHPESGEFGPVETEGTNLKRSRDEFIQGLTIGSSDINNLTQNFVPAILPALKLGFKLAGRPRVVNLIANVVAKLLKDVVSKDQATPLSRALVDAGLRLVNLETSEIIPAEQYLGSTIANIVTETTDTVSQFPLSMLEGTEEEISPFVQEAVMEATANNVNVEVLTDESLRLRQVPQDANWVPRNNGKYKVLSKKYSIVLDPGVAASIHTRRRAETLLDVLHSYQGWDGKSPVPVMIYVFEATPLTRLRMIAKDYVGGGSYNQIRQILRLGHRAATLLLKEPQLATHKRRESSIAGLRFYYVKLDVPAGKASTPEAVVENKERSNDIDLRLIPPDKLELRLFLNGAACQRIKDSVGGIQSSRLYKELESMLLPTGQNTLNKLLARLNVPSFASNEILSHVLQWILKNLKSGLPEIVKNVVEQPSISSVGVTIIMDIELPGDFLTSLPGLSIEKIGGFIAKLANVSPTGQVKIVSGYKL